MLVKQGLKCPISEKMMVNVTFLPLGSTPGEPFKPLSQPVQAMTNPTMLIRFIVVGMVIRHRKCFQPVDGSCHVANADLQMAKCEKLRKGDSEM